MLRYRVYGIEATIDMLNGMGIMDSSLKKHAALLKDKDDKCILQWYCILQSPLTFQLLTSTPVPPLFQIFPFALLKEATLVISLPHP
jgi:hypothetical protein